MPFSKQPIPPGWEERVRAASEHNYTNGAAAQELGLTSPRYLSWCRRFRILTAFERVSGRKPPWMWNAYKSESD